MYILERQACGNVLGIRKGDPWRFSIELLLVVWILVGSISANRTQSMTTQRVVFSICHVLKCRSDKLADF